MNEYPILFNSEMVRAILDGRKTQTRRLKGLKKQIRSIKYVHGMGGWYVIYSDDEWEVVPFPYGKPGDRLWVRETWRPWSWHEGEPISVQFKADMKHAPADKTSTLSTDREAQIIDWEERMWIQITDELTEKGHKPDKYGFYHFDDDPPLRWRPSIHMPRWASRILLEITQVRVERLQEINIEDCYAEGIRNEYYHRGSIGSDFSVRNTLFPKYWDSINGKSDFSWKSNPWVFVIEFKRI